jgi:hypothetical protein
MHWSADPSEAGYKKHGLIGTRAEQATKSSWSGRTHQREAITFDGFQGAIDVLGGDWWIGSWKLLSALSEDSAPSASPDHLKAQAAPTQAGAPPEQPEGSPWPQQPASGRSKVK